MSSPCCPFPRFQRALLALSAAAMPLLAASCRGGASYPDAPQVTAAQADWCKALAKLSGAPDAWEYMSTCKAAYPTASAAYLQGMTKCFAARHEALGDKAEGNSQIVADCNEEVAVNMPADEAESREVIAARCQRAERCEKIPAADCKAAIDKLPNAQRVVFTTTYNAGALHTIADCLSSQSCSDNEEEARNACYKPAADKLLWFPP